MGNNSNSLKSVFIILIFTISIFNPNITISTEEPKKEYPQFQIIGDLEQFLDGRKIMTRCGESVLKYQNIEATDVIQPESKILELRSFSITNNSSKEIYVSFRKTQNENSSLTLFDKNWHEIGATVCIPAHSISVRLNLKLDVHSVSCCNNTLYNRIFSAYQVNEDGVVVTRDNKVDFSILCLVDDEHFECRECTIDDDNAYWATLSTMSYSNKTYRLRDGNISSSPLFASNSSPYGESIAIGNNRLHVVWIEEDNNKIRNAFYSYADLPAYECNRWSNPICVTKFVNKNIQVENVIVGSRYDKAFIIVNVEVNRGEKPLETEWKDDHFLFCIVVNQDDPCHLFTLCPNSKQQSYIPPKSRKDVMNNPANISHNDQQDTWHPSVSVDPHGRPHIAWQSQIKYSRTKFTSVFKDGIYWTFFDEGWKTVQRNSSGLPVLYEYSDSADCNAVVISDINHNYNKPSLDTSSLREPWVSETSCLHIGFLENKNIRIVGRYWDNVNQEWGRMFDQYNYDSDNLSKEISVSIFGNRRKSYFSTLQNNSLSTNLNMKRIVGNINSISIVVARCTLFCFHAVYEMDGEIYYFVFLGGGRGIVGPINISNNSGHSHSPSLALDDRYFPHIAWTDESPAGIPEIIYCGLRCRLRTR